MFRLKIVFIRFIANVFIRLRYRAIQRAQPRFVVVSGSVGKTIMRRALHHAFVQNGKPSFTLDTDYVNEFGLLLSVLGVKKFHLLSVSDWLALVRARPISGYVVIEMGADFRNDIVWFLRYFKPVVVVLTQGTDMPWTDRVQSVLEERMNLVKSATECVFVSSLDTVHRTLLLDTNSKIQIVDVNSDDVYSYPIALASRLGCNNRDYIKAQCSTNRLTVINSKNSSILLDQYKVTPVCLSYILSQVQKEDFQVSILVMNEIRPHPANIEIIYETFIPQLQQFKKVLYIGDKAVYHYLLSRLSNFELLDEISIEATKNLLKQAKHHNQESLMVVKTSAHYQASPETQLIRSLIDAC